VGPEDLVSVVDEGAYVTGTYALFRRGMVEETPGEVTCFTNRRHNRGDRETPAGRLRFRCVPPGIYAKTPKQVVASAEQALCDFAWLNVGDEEDPPPLGTLRKLDSLNGERLEKVLQRYPWRVRAAVKSLLTTAGVTRGEPTKAGRAPYRPRVRRVIQREVVETSAAAATQEEAQTEVRWEEAMPEVPQVELWVPEAKPSEEEVVTEVGERRQENSWAVWD
jgi:hypothetical protein